MKIKLFLTIVAISIALVSKAQNTTDSTIIKAKKFFVETQKNVVVETRIKAENTASVAINIDKGILLDIVDELEKSISFGNELIKKYEDESKANMELSAMMKQKNKEKGELMKQIADLKKKLREK